MSTTRWTQHRLYEGNGQDYAGEAPINMWWIARAAAEETLQGSPLARSWLKLFRTHLSVTDRHWLRWRGDMAESAEMRRAYSGLYGRFVARALLQQHLGFTCLLSLGRNGLIVPGGISVHRNGPGDIPDWVGWDPRSKFIVLGEAKGSLSATDFMSPGGPRCVHSGKEQFDRVTVMRNGVNIDPLKWVAATRWATEQRRGRPATVLWDPPTERVPLSEQEADELLLAMRRAWLTSIAPGFGFRTVDDLEADDREREALIVSAQPGSIPADEDWPMLEYGEEVYAVGVETNALLAPPSTIRTGESAVSKALAAEQRVMKPLESIEGLPISAQLLPRRGESKLHLSRYTAAVVTRFGIRPIRTHVDIEELRRLQEKAINRDEPALLVGLPIKPCSTRPIETATWLDGAGFVQPGELAIFDLRRIVFGSMDLE